MSLLIFQLHLDSSKKRKLEESEPVWHHVGTQCDFSNEGKIYLKYRDVKEKLKEAKKTIKYLKSNKYLQLKLKEVIHPDRLQALQRAKVKLLCTETDHVVPVSKPRVGEESLDKYVPIDPDFLQPEWLQEIKIYWLSSKSLKSRNRVFFKVIFIKKTTYKLINSERTEKACINFLFNFFV